MSGLDGDWGGMSLREEAEWRRRLFPETGEGEWENWEWQAAHRVRRAEEVANRIADLSERERGGLMLSERWRMPLCLTPYALVLVAADRPDGPIRRMLLPDEREGRRRAEEREDPLGEGDHEVASGLVRAYPHKALFLASGDCAAACRYCTRSRTAGRFGTAEAGDGEEALRWLDGCGEIRDVLVSGGDPLMLGDERLAALLGRLRGMQHVRLIRVGTKTPATLPQRITGRLVEVLKGAAPLWASVHVSHPAELTERACGALRRLAGSGIPVMNQCVLLKGVNDREEVLGELFERLVWLGVKPYYLHHGDLAAGTGHFRCTKATGRRILRNLQGTLPGYAMPLFMEDPPGGGKKRALGW
jgi:lysine 2,3-aminomutase